MDKEPLEFDGIITDQMVAAEVNKCPLSGNIAIHTTLCNLVDKASAIGATNDHLDKMILIFLRDFLPNSWNSLQRLSGESLFEATLGLCTHHSMLENLQQKLSNITRMPDQNITVALHSIKSLCSVLTTLTIPDITPAKLAEKLESIQKRLIPKLINNALKKHYLQFLTHHRTTLGEEVSLQDRIDFVTKYESFDKEVYLPSEPLKVKDGNIPIALYFTRLCGGQGTEDLAMMREEADLYEAEALGLDSEMEYDGDENAELYMTTRSMGGPLVQPLHGVGDRVGVLDRAHRSVSSASGGPTQHNISASVYHGNGTGSAASSAPSSRPQSGEANGVPGPVQSEGWSLVGTSQSTTSSVAGTEGGSTNVSGQDRGRTADKWRPGQTSISPGSGKTKYYRRTPSGSYRSLNRSDIYVKRGDKGFVPRGTSRSPSYPWKRVGDVPKSRCPRCFRYIGSNIKGRGPACNMKFCARYKDSKLESSTPLCKCGGGFHAWQICERSKSGTSPSRGFNQNLQTKN